MYAIVEINGQQFKAEEGKKLFINHMKDVEAGKTVEFDKVLLVDNEGSVQVGAPTVSGAKVVCEVINPLVKGEKVIVFKMKRRKDSRKMNGHRQQYTQVEVMARKLLQATLLFASAVLSTTQATMLALVRTIRSTLSLTERYSSTRASAIRVLYQ